jgi:acetyltransferase-like isoleucine patch superfamily enzyme
MQRILIKLIGFVRHLERRKNLSRLGLYHLSIKSQVLASLTFGPFVDSKTNTLQVGEGSLIRGVVSFVRNGAGLVVGSNTAINGSTSFSIASSVEIGNNVLISFDCLFMDHDGHSSDPEFRGSDLPDLLNDRPKAWEMVKISPIRIEDSAWIGARSIILKGVTIGQGSIVAAGSVVTKSVPPFVIVAGNPARQVNKVRGEKV